MSEPRQPVLWLAAVLVAVGVLALVVWAGSVLLSGDSGGPETDSAATLTVEPRSVVGFDFTDSVALGVDPGSGRVPLPDCFGAVERIAVVSEDLTETYWEVTAGDGQGVPVESFGIGESIAGFDLEVALLGARSLRGLIVVNGTDHLGLGRLGTPAPAGASTC